MRKILVLLIAILTWGIFSCKNDDWQFPDFDYTTTYFPYQYPIRTLVLGNYMWDNTNDNNLKFKVSARVGGMYENNSDWTVEYKLDPGLVTKLAAASNLLDGKTTVSRDTLIILPSQYYTLTPVNKFVISAGTLVGEIEVQLTDAFLNDPLAVKTKYVLPLSIISSTTDSVLLGKTSVKSPDPRKPSDWVIRPKNFTIFGIKFVNTYHGKYLHRGVSVITDTTTSTVLETIIYRQKYVEQDELWSLQTIGRNAVRVTGTLRKTPASPGTFTINLTFDSNNNCIISTATGSAFKVTGTGKFVPEGGIWGNVPQNAIFLNYVVRQGANKHAITDTLVFRDKAVIFQEYTPEILQ